MSEWYEIKNEDIEVDMTEKEINILVTDNDCGNVYATLTFEQIKSIYNDIDKLLK